MPQLATAITPARFDQGLSYAAFLPKGTVNLDKFEASYRTVPLSDDDISFFRKAAALRHGLAKILAIAEPWCGDVYRELPTVVRIAELTGLELRIFPRDENPDIMDEFLSHHGNARAIPVFVFYTANLGYIAHFTERSASAHAGVAAAIEAAKAQLGLPANATFGNVRENDSQRFLRDVVARVRPHVDEWRKDAIKEIRELLSTALRIPNAG